MLIGPGKTWAHFITKADGDKAAFVPRKFGQNRESTSLAFRLSERPQKEIFTLIAEIPMPVEGHEIKGYNMVYLKFLRSRVHNLKLFNSTNGLAVEFETEGGTGLGLHSPSPKPLKDQKTTRLLDLMRSLTSFRPANKRTTVRLWLEHTRNDGGIGSTSVLRYRRDQFVRGRPHGS